MRRPAALTRPKPRQAKPASFPAPVGGWISNTNLATPGARMPDGSKVSGAFVLENYFPIATGVRMRRGSDPYAQLGDGSAGVVSMFAYVNGNNRKLFASTAAAIYDITSPADVNSVGAPAVASLTGGAWSVAQTETPGGVFLRCVNGVDTPLVYDGTSFATAPAITGAVPTTLSYVWVHQQRLFFVEKDSLSAWYLPADAIGGAAVELPLGAVFTRGGSLLFGSSWSLETGNGLHEQCVFITTEGEAAIFQGTDPSTAATWSKVGVYRIGKPLGPKAHFRAGGDLAIATDIGLVPLSQAMQRDYSAVSASAVSFPIENAWNQAVAARSLDSWSCEVWPTKQMVLVAPPHTSGVSAEMFAANVRTGAWGRFTGWDGKCLQLFGDRLFFGSSNGLVIEAEVTGADQGAPYTSVCVPLFDPLKSPATLKTSLLMRATIRAPAEVVPQLSLQVDYRVSLPTPPDAGAVSLPSASNAWGVGIWGQSTWGAQSLLNVYQQWQSVGGAGYAIAPCAQITSGSIVPPDVELVTFDLTYDMGDIVS